MRLHHEPLGMLDLWMWKRELKDSDGNHPGLKESGRRTEGYERVAERARQLRGGAGVRCGSGERPV